MQDKHYLRTERMSQPVQKVTDMMPEQQKNYFKLHLFALKLMGVYIGDFENNYHKFVCEVYSTIFLTFCIYMYIITEAIDLIVNWGDLNNMTFNSCYLGTHFTGLCKALVILTHRDNIKKYIRQLESGYFLPNFERGGLKEFKIIETATRKSNIQMYIFHSLVIITVVNRGLYAGFDKGYFDEIFEEGTNSTVLKHHQVVPYTTWFPFDTNVSPYYEIGFSYQIISCTLYGLLVFTCDALIISLMMHLKAQLLILNNSLRYYVVRAKGDHIKYAHLKTNSSIFTNDDGIALEKLRGEVQQSVTKYIGEIIRHHQGIIMLSEKAEMEFTYLMLAQFLGSLVLLCFQLFQLSLYEVNSPKFFSMMSYLCLMLFQLLMYCWNGNEIRVESLNIADAVYSSDWIVTDKSTQRALALMMQRAQRPLKLSAGKFAYLNLETFVNILRASASYYMVLRRVNL